MWLLKTFRSFDNLDFCSYGQLFSLFTTYIPKEMSLINDQLIQLTYSNFFLSMI